MNPPLRNPILPGFHPDPPLLRVGDDFYLANSTFEWFPGVITSLQQVNWPPDGWLRLTSGGNTPALEVPAPRLLEHPWPAPPQREDFDLETLPTCFHTLLEPPTEAWLPLRERPGFPRL